MSAVVAPGAWWAATRRLDGWLAVGFAVAPLILAGAVVYGATGTGISLSMHYNRWAWAVVFAPLLIAALPARRPGEVWDGVIVGLSMAVLALLKITFFVGFAPAVLVGLILRRAWLTLIISVVAGLAVCVAVTMAYGVSFWMAYLNDLREISSSGVRSAPVEAQVSHVVIWPKYLGATLVGIGTLWWVRKQGSGMNSLLVTMALILPGGIYAAYQNYGHDPIWLIWWGIVVLALRPKGQAAGGVPMVLGVAALAMVFPVAVNMALSPVRPLTQPKAAFEPLLTEADRLYGVTARFDAETGKQNLRSDKCQLIGGAVSRMRREVEILQAHGLGGRPVLEADLLNVQWLFGGVPLKGGAPWYFGGLPGFEAAELVVVPSCPADPAARDMILKKIEAQGVTLALVLQDGMMDVFEIKR